MAEPLSLNKLAPEFMRNPSFVDIYASGARVTASAYDLSFTFTRPVELRPGSTVIEDLAVVRMSPHHFKSFIKQCSLMMQGWEDAFGTVQDNTPSPFTAEQVRNAMTKLKQQAQ
jgi:hypothetical protein